MIIPSTNTRIVKLKSITRTRSGNGKLIKGKQEKFYRKGLFPAFSASGQDIWVEHPEHTGTAIILSAVGARCGKAFLAQGRWSAVANTHIIWPDETVVNPRWLFMLLNDELFWERGGSAQPFIRVAKTLEKEAYLPSLGEQENIVKTVYNLKSNIQKAKEQLGKASRLFSRYRESILSAAIDGKLLQKSGPWVRHALSEQVSWGPQNGIYLPQSKYGLGTRIVRIDDFQPHWIRSVEDLRLVNATDAERLNYGLRAGDLVINRVNSPSHLGKLFVAPTEYDGVLFESNMMRLRLSEAVLPQWVALFLSSPEGSRDLKRNAKWAVNQASINQADVLGVEIPVPSLEEQRVILLHVEKALQGLDKIVSEHANSIRLLTKLDHAILEKALRRKS